MHAVFLFPTDGDRIAAIAMMGVFQSMTALPDIRLNDYEEINDRREFWRSPSRNFRGNRLRHRSCLLGALVLGGPQRFGRDIPRLRTALVARLSVNGRRQHQLDEGRCGARIHSISLGPSATGS